MLKSEAFARPIEPPRTITDAENFRTVLLVINPPRRPMWPLNYLRSRDHYLVTTIFDVQAKELARSNRDGIDIVLRKRSADFHLSRYGVCDNKLLARVAVDLGCSLN